MSTYAHTAWAFDHDHTTSTSTAGDQTIWQGVSGRDLSGGTGKFQYPLGGLDSRSTPLSDRMAASDGGVLPRPKITAHE